MEECMTENVWDVELPPCNFNSNKTARRWSVKRKCRDPSREWPRRNVPVRNREKVDKASEALQAQTPGSISSPRRAPRPRIMTRGKPNLENEYFAKQSNFFVGFTENPCTEAAPPNRSAYNAFPLGSPHVERRTVRSIRKAGAHQRSAHVFRNEVLELKRALMSERETLRKLYEELEEERRASATAAHEAIAMITRLQEEKAAALIESRQYRHAAEEREAHTHEAISLLKAALLDRESELQFLQDHVGSYRRMLEYETYSEKGCTLSPECETDAEEKSLLSMSQKSGLLVYARSSCRNALFGNGTIETGTIVSDKIAEHPHHNESPSSISGREINTDRDNHHVIMDTGSTPGVADRSDYIQQKHCEGRYLQADWRTQNVEKYTLSSEDTSKTNTVCKAAEPEMFVSEFDCHSNSQANTFEDTSISILARVEQLEERFKYLQRCQEFYNGQRNLNSEGKRRASGSDGFRWNSALEELSDQDGYCNMEPYKILPCRFHRSQNNVSLDDSHQVLFGDIEFLQCDRIHNAVAEQRCDYSSFDLGADSESKGHMFQWSHLNIRKDLNRQAPTAEAEDANEGIHDVYEVKCEESGNAPVHNCCLTAEEYHVRDNYYTMTCEGKEFQRFSKEFESNKNFESGRNIEEDSTMDKLLLDLGSLEVKPYQKHTPDGGLQQLKERLKALEGEREVMKQAIESLRKENYELKLLQQIAQHFQDVRTGIRVTESKDTAGQHQIPLFSFLKNLFSLTRIQYYMDREEIRCSFLQSLKSGSDKKEDGGLFHLLSSSSGATKSVCITRGYNVKFAIYGGT